MGTDHHRHSLCNQTLCACVDYSASTGSFRSRRHAMRILVVDDWPDGAASWVMLLQLLGFEADAATDGHQALEIARTRRPDVALLDLNMPRLDGCELAPRLRALYPDRLILIAITAHD